MIRSQHLLLSIAVLTLASCSSDDDGNDTVVPLEPVGEESGSEDISAVVDNNSLAINGCQNVVIIDEFAYAACGTGIEVVDLNTLERNFITLAADDITGDADVGVLFTQSGNTLQQFDLVNPLQPNPVATVATNFSVFSGVSADNGILVVSAGSGGSNTEVYTYDANSLSLAVAGIPVVDGRTGNPDVHVAVTDTGATAYYSQDLGAVANWGIQIVEFDIDGNILALPEVVVLAPELFTGSFGVPFGPANFPVEGEFLNDRLYVAHFAADGVQVIDRSASNALSLIPLGYEPTNITTDGDELFVVGVSRSIVDTINPTTETVVDSLNLPLVQPVGIAASETHIAVADRSAGLVIVTR